MKYDIDELCAAAVRAAEKIIPEIIEQANDDWNAKRGHICFECGNTKACHQHHVVPRSLGGKNTVPLCEECHGKVHGLKMENHGNVIRIGLAEARRKGVKLGRKPGSTLDPSELLAKHQDVVRLLKAKHSVRHAAKIAGKSPSTVLAVRKAMRC